MKIIGFSGKATVGKTTTAVCLKKLLSEEGIESKILSMAYPLKKAASVMTGLDMRFFTDSDKKDKVIISFGVTPREFMQKMATEFARDMIHHNFWIIRMKQSLHKFADIPIILIDDIRFENEAALVRRNGVMVHLHRNVCRNDTHKSEQPLTKYKYDLCIDSENHTAEEVAAMVKEEVFNGYT